MISFPENLRGSLCLGGSPFFTTEAPRHKETQRDTKRFVENVVQQPHFACAITYRAHAVSVFFVLNVILYPKALNIRLIQLIFPE